MKGRVIALDHMAGRQVAALLQDGRLQDLLVSGDGPVPGAIYRAMADRPVKGQGGMFLKTPDGSAYLRQVKGLSPGTPLLVQVTGHAEPGKAIPVTSKVLFKGRYAIITPESPGVNVSRQIRDDDERERILETAHDVMTDSTMGLILRSACEGSSLDDVAEDIAAMRELAEAVTSDLAGNSELLVAGDTPHALAWRDWPLPAQIDRDAGSLDRSGALDQIETLQDDRVDLGAGASMYVEPTRALVAVDVNTGSDTSPAAGLKANIAAARDLPRQLRLRGLGGQIVVDLAPMPKKERRGFEGALRAAFRACSVDTTLVGWTTLGHYELQRKRDRFPLPELS
jgi:ribonuclease G